MTIIEAIKSGKSFRRKAFVKNQPNRWFSYVNQSQVMTVCDPTSEFHHASYEPCKEDILADDWEIEEKKVEITRAQFNKACEVARLKSAAFAGIDMAATIADLLGL